MTKRPAAFRKLTSGYEYKYTHQSDVSVPNEGGTLSKVRLLVEIQTEILHLLSHEIYVAKRPAAFGALAFGDEYIQTHTNRRLAFPMREALALSGHVITIACTLILEIEYRGS